MSGLSISAGTLTGTVADLPAATLAAAFGSIASALRCLCDVRFTPNSGHCEVLACSIRRLCLREFPCAIQRFGARTIETHHVVPPVER
jgi:hypothetical protein